MVNEGEWNSKMALATFNFLDLILKKNIHFDQNFYLHFDKKYILHAFDKKNCPAVMIGQNKLKNDVKRI